LGVNQNIAKSFLPMLVYDKDFLKNITIIKIKADHANHNLALSDSGEVFSWGNNDYGQLGFILNFF
jgi:alpha-tubulin suppressor-like RCC1 family protein